MKIPNLCMWLTTIQVNYIGENAFSSIVNSFYFNSGVHLILENIPIPSKRIFGFDLLKPSLSFQVRTLRT